MSGGMASSLKELWIPRILLAVVVLALWELAGHSSNGEWISRPSLIIVRLVELAGNGLHIDLAVTLYEIFCGLLIGGPAGVLMGLWLGRSRIAAGLLSPVLVALNSVPFVALAPLLIMWFGLGMMPKIVLVSLVSFFIMFFNTYSGVAAIDRDFIDALKLMGASSNEQFRKVILPGCTTWIMSGLKSAIPYALIAATVGEMMLARHGLGHLVTAAASQFDMTGVYAALFILMMLGILLNEVTSQAEAYLLRWRTVR